MSSVALVARLILCVLFATAGVAKLLDRQTSSDTVEAFGVPKRLAAVGGTLLPLVELAVATCLLIEPIARWAAVAALLLLALFSAGVGLALANGRTPNCNCFGVVSSEAISWRTVARNVVIGVIAGLVVIGGPDRSLATWTANAHAADLVASLSVLALAFAAVVALHYRSLAVVRDSETTSVSEPAAAQPAGPVIAVGERAPKFSLSDLDGAMVSLDDMLGRGLPVLLVLASPACGPCRALLPKLAQWRISLSDRMSFLVVESGVGTGLEHMKRDVPAAEALTVVYESGFNVSITYGAQKTPTALLLNPDGRIADGPVSGDRAVEALVRSSLNSAAPAAATA